MAKYIPDDDIARAYFQGEVWRIEGESQVAKKTFKEQTGMDPAAKAKQENKESREAPGIVETVAPGERYRFMNLGNEVAEPKPEHIDFFKQIYKQFIENDPTARVRLVGHASSPGTKLARDGSADLYTGCSGRLGAAPANNRPVPGACGKMSQ